MPKNRVRDLFNLDGKAREAAGDAQADEKLFRRVLELEPSSTLAGTHFQLGELYRKRGRQPDADRERKLFQTLRDMENECHTPASGPPRLQ